jgi:hypothetical protein
MLPTDRVRTSPAPCTTTALQENEYEIHNRHAFAHDIGHNRCGCPGWKRAWPPQFAGHRHATAGTCADDCFADKAAVEVFPAQVGIGFNDKIASKPESARGDAALRRESAQVFGRQSHCEQPAEGRDASGNQTTPMNSDAAYAARFRRTRGRGERGARPVRRF